MAKADEMQEDDAFTPEQESRLKELLREAVGGGKQDDSKNDKAPPAVSDDEWNAMSDRRRESYVEGLVKEQFDKLRMSNKVDDIASKIDKLDTQPEEKPKVLSSLTRWLWGDDV